MAPGRRAGGHQGDGPAATRATGRRPPGRRAGGHQDQDQDQDQDQAQDKLLQLQLLGGPNNCSSQLLAGPVFVYRCTNTRRADKQTTSGQLPRAAAGRRAPGHQVRGSRTRPANNCSLQLTRPRITAARSYSRGSRGRQAAARAASWRTIHGARFKARGARAADLVSATRGPPWLRPNCPMV